MEDTIEIEVRMGFTKANIRREFDIPVEHPLYPGVVFSFTVRTRLTKDADDARQQMFAVSDDAEESVHRAATSNMLSQIVVAEPKGFDDFPTEGDLAQRVREYFNDEELDSIRNFVLNSYWGAIMPRPAMKSVQGDSPAGGVPRRAAKKAVA